MSDLFLQGGAASPANCARHIQDGEDRGATIRFVVIGKPETAGSKRSFVPINKKTGQPYRDARTGRVIVNTVDDNPDTKSWQAAVRDAARAAWSGGLLDGPLVVSCQFFTPRPLGHYGSGRNANVLKPGAPKFPAGKPDLLKLTRAIEDALTGVVWRDDARGVRMNLAKDYGAPARAEVEIRPAPGTVFVFAPEGR